MLRSKPTAIGRIAIEIAQGRLTRLYLPCEAPEAPCPEPGSLAAEAFRQLEEYLRGQRTAFRLPLAEPTGTPLQRRIARAIAAIPYGKTATYGSLGPARVAGHVCAINPLPLIIPCHRVLPACNPPGRYRGSSALKAYLLRLESGIRLQPYQPLSPS